MVEKIKVCSYIRKAQDAWRIAFKYFFRFALSAMRYAFLFLICALFLSSCTKPLYKNQFIISGTYLEVISPYKEAAAICYQEFKRLDRIFNYYDSASEISQLNQTYNEPFVASAELIEALQLSKQIYQESRGAFDISCGALYSFWKDLTRKEKIEEFPSPQTVNELKSLCGMDNIEINAQQNRVTIKKKGLKIDLAGIAKGYIVDKAVAKLKEAGLNSALINAGGDIYCLGKNSDRAWKVGIKNPKYPQSIVESENLINEAIVTSGSYEQFFVYKDERYSHLIDSRTGYPVKTDIVSVSVVSKSCAIADSLATSFFIMGIDGINKFLPRSPYKIKVFVVRFEGDQEKLDILQ